jgi:F-type H+-transporting ATPase subunit b
MIESLFILAAEAAEEAPAAGGSLPQMDVSTFPSQIFWLAVTFGALYLIMSRMVLPRLGAAIEERRDRIADDLDRAAESKRMAEEAEAAYNRALAEARAKSQAIAAETRDEVNAEIAVLQKKAGESLAERAAAAEAKIAAMKGAAAAKVREAAADTTRAIVETLIQETPAEAAVEAAVAKAAGAR